MREVGSGTRVQLHNYGWARELEVLVLVAPAGHAQFSVFIEQFQRCAAAGGSLLLYLERLKKDTIEDCYTVCIKEVSVMWLSGPMAFLWNRKSWNALGSGDEHGSFLTQIQVFPLATAYIQT